MARGRPISFDRNATLEKAQHVFWQAGFAGASYTDLCAATGLTKPSLYAAYGNKEETFLAALDMYLDQVIRPGLVDLAREPDAREGLKTLLTGTVDGLTAEGTPKGCMIANNIASGTAPDMPKTVSDALYKAVKETPDAILRRLSQAPPGELPPGTNPATMANYCEALISGLSGLARQGMTREELLAVVETALAIWPDQSRQE